MVCFMGDRKTMTNRILSTAIIKVVSESEMPNKPIQLTPVRRGALLALRLLKQARVPEASRCS